MPPASKKGLGKHPVLLLISIAVVLLLLTIYLYSGGSWENAVAIGNSIGQFFAHTQVLEAILTLMILLASVCLLVLVFYGLLCVVKNGINHINIDNTSSTFGKRTGGIIKSLTEATVGSVDTILRYIAYVPSFFEALIDLLLEDDTDDIEASENYSDGGGI